MCVTCADQMFSHAPGGRRHSRRSSHQNWTGKWGPDNRNIPAALQRYMAKRSRARRTTEIPGASHAVAVAHPGATAHMILEAPALHAA